MPLFDYKCEECKIKEEILVESKNTEVFCKECGRQMQRIEMNVTTSIFSDRAYIKGKKQLLN